ncbi:MAG: branched-chain amino acid ABC transporter permease [Chloroflexi bacterium]|nr:branched-chain amino acid ABC transporter permease [Chloroflexota bacterium]
MTSRLALATAIRIVVALVLVTFPLFGSDFQVIQIGAQSLFLGIVALSLAFLAGYGGMVSLAQTAIYGVAGYAFGILAVSHPSPGLGVGPLVVTQAYPWWVGAIGGLAAATVVAFLFGLISVRTRGIYFLMITLALGMIVYNFAEENYTILNGHGGIGGEQAPRLAGISFGDPRPFYYLCLVVAALLYLGLTYLVRSPFGLALQGVRDNARRMRALGYWPEAHRIAAFTLGGFVAGVGGILGVWYYQTISPGSIDLTRTIDILIIAVVGGLIYFEGAFLGALIFVLVNNFASSYTDRYNTVIGLTFLLIVLFSPNGIVGLGQGALRLARAALRRRPGAGGRQPQDAAAGPAAPAGRAGTGALSAEESSDKIIGV